MNPEITPETMAKCLDIFTKSFAGRVNPAVLGKIFGEDRQEYMTEVFYERYNRNIREFWCYLDNANRAKLTTYMLEHWTG